MPDIFFIVNQYVRMHKVDTVNLLAANTRNLRW